MDASTVVYIHEYLTEFFQDKEDPISPPGVKNLDSIESAAARPFATAGGQDAYPTVFDKAASLFHSVACNHSFHNGNKRAALLSTMYFLSEYGYWLEKCSDDELYEFTRQIAAHEISEDRRNEVPVISEWLEKNSRKQQKGEKPLKLTHLRDILSRFGFNLRDIGKTLEVLRDGIVVETILKKGSHGFEDYDPAYISELRRRLELTADHGVDSSRFYGQKGISDELNEFMQLRLDVMKRLAKI
ncbi:type II toxin-antitoxin system death-on-curing family toxin [Ideonella livida]|uniref:Type II toxin-antitoxin system death-on-curing family toxin n=1 Tax=Ideonella livida TaxID=2707176 RepID=A0A7C9PKW2_9BURK|nr:type II toxin-antitoxin system death-on-curing family toxin [Ideonella livida]NDY94071.1 type II toxin-antitoxin system death-on-curing family toxin [Ideonella livida]